MASAGAWSGRDRQRKVELQLCNCEKVPVSSLFLEEP